MELFGSLTIAIALGGAVVVMKLRDQKNMDERKTYIVTFPADLTGDRVLAWLHAISGSMKSPKNALAARPSLVFELWSTDMGVTYRIKVPWRYADTISKQIRSAIPGTNLTEDTQWPSLHWRQAQEVGMTNKSRPLRIPRPTDTAHSIVSSTRGLRAGEAIIVQWIVTPKPLERQPEHASSIPTNEFSWHSILLGNSASKDEVTERREKLAEPNMMAALRVGAIAATDSHAKHLIQGVRDAMSAISTGANQWTTTRFDNTKAVRERIIRAAGKNIDWPIQLNLTELATLIAWPIDNPFVEGLARGVSRQLPANQSVPTTGIVIGNSSFPGSERPIAIQYDKALMHTEVLGKTGTGKSVLLAHMARQIMEQGHGLVVIETEGNLYNSVLDYVPADRVDDVVLMDVTDTSYPVGFNILDQGHRDTTIDQVIALLEHLYGKDGMGVWAQEYIYHGLKTIGERADLSFIDLVPLLNPHSDEVAWADEVVRNIKDPELKRWWQRHDNRGKADQQKRADPVLSRIWQLGSRPELRYIFGQQRSTIKIEDVFRDGKILLVNLKGTSPKTAALIATLVMNSIWHEIKAGRKEKSSYLMLDEFADFMDLPIDTESMLAQSRKHNVGMVLAHQHLSQLKPSVRDAVLTNTRNKVIFQSNADDATAILKEMPAHITNHDITNLSPFHAYADVLTDQGNSGPISVAMRDSTRSTGQANRVRYLSREKYGRPIQEVKAEMEGRHQTPEIPVQKRPPLSGEGW